MIQNIETYILLFTIYAIIGWLMEVSLSFIQHHKFVNRGFLIGPYCPIYGFGGVTITILPVSYTHLDVYKRQFQYNHQ